MMTIARELLITMLRYSRAEISNHHLDYGMILARRCITPLQFQRLVHAVPVGQASVFGKQT